MTFAAPIFLAALGLLLPLIIAYLVRRRRTVVRVPSTLRWRTVAVSRHRNRRFQFLSRLLSLLACVAAVWALAFAAARPMVSGEGETMAIVIDTSSSMGTADQGPLADAIELAEDLVASRSPRDRIVLLAAGEEPIRLAGPSADGGILDRGLTGLTPSLRSDVPAALTMAAGLIEGEPRAHILLLHDGGANTAGLDLPVPLAERRFGAGRENLGVTAFAARPARDAHTDDDREVLVGVAAAGDTARRARVVLEAVEDGHSVVVGEQEVTIAAGREQDLRFRLQLPVSTLVARVVADDARPDALASDDQATLELGASAAPTAHLVNTADESDDTAARFFAERALRAAGVDSADADADADADAEVTDGIAIHFGAPTRRYDVPELILGGRAPNQAAPSATNTASTGATPSRWPARVRSIGQLEGLAANYRTLESNHPVTRGVSLDGVTIVRATAIDPGEGVPLVELDGAGEGGTVVAAGGAGRDRWVYIGLEPEGSDVVLRVAYPVLVANAIAWLGGATESVVAETPPASEVRLAASTSTLPTAPELSTWGIPSLPVWLGVLAMLLLGIEGFAYKRRWVR